MVVHILILSVKPLAAILRTYMLLRGTTMRKVILTNRKINSITTRSGLTTTKHSIPLHVLPTPREEVEKETETLMDELHITSPTSTAHVPPPGIQPVSQPKPKEDPKPNPHQPKIPYSLRLDKTKLLDKNDVLKKLRDPRKFLIHCVLQDLKVCISLANSKANINLMRLSINEKLRIEPLKPTRMTLKLANISVTYLLGIAEDVIVKVDKLNFLPDFVIGDFEADPTDPIILGRPFLRTAKAFVDLYEQKLTLRIENEYFVLKIFQKIHQVMNVILFLVSILYSPCEEISNQNKQNSGSTTSHSDLSLFNYESFCFDIDHQEEKSSGSTTSKSDYSLPNYEAFYFEEKNSGSTTSHFNPSFLEYESFYFDLSIDPLPPVERSDSHHEEFTDKLTHIMSPSKYDHFYFDIEVDPGELTRLLIENSSSKNVNLTKIKEDNELKPKTSTKELTIHELNDLCLLLSNCASTFSEEFFEIDF
nr:reverse transcriptase domain-containing protein [Tanacetum cinerariifolium]